MNKLESVINFFKNPIFTYGIFWSWNLIFLVLLLFIESQGRFLFSIIKNAFTGYTPLDFSFYALLILFIPIGSTILALTKLRAKPLQLLKFFYGVELPLGLLFLLRLTVFRELNASTFHLFLFFALGIISFLSEILISENKSPKWLLTAQKIGHTLLLIIGIYFSLVLIFYSLPIAWTLIIGFFKFEWLEIFEAGFWIILFVLFFTYTATLFVILPISMVWLYIKAFIRNYNIPTSNGKAIIFATLGINIFLLFALNFSQPQTAAFEKLEIDFSKTENKLQFYKNTKKIKKGLLNAYLSAYRYISSIDKDNHIKELYQDSFSLSDGITEGIQNFHNFIMSPFLYDGDMAKDRLRAKELYEQYFDGSIQKYEKETIIKSMKATWDSDGIEAGLLNINQEKVHIEKQEITVNEKEELAEVEIYEIYRNKTFDRQEIFYYFSLPQNAVITGLWLSDDDNEKKKYAFNVSPRGAAQKVYKAEVQRRVDPSLLEQVGPNQYRFRAFPIEPKIRTHDYEKNSISIEDGKQFHLWLSYKTLLSKDKKWELPRLSEKRNVYWSDDTELIINSKAVDRKDAWLPKNITAKYKGEIQRHIVQLTDSTHIKIEPMTLKQNINIEDKKIALLIDGSYSMISEKENLRKVLLDFETKGFKADNINYFVINKIIEEYEHDKLIADLNGDEMLFFETTNYMNMVNLFTANNSDNYDAIVLLSDKGNYESSEDSIKAVELSAPLYVLHIGKEQAPIYNDDFLETIQNSNGHIIRNIDELLNQFNLNKLFDNNILAYENGIMYSKIETKEAVSESAFSELASKVLIKNIKILNDSNRVQQLDGIHQIALKEQIVTPYSSMIVLVNDRQKEALKKAEAEADRFDREVESGDEDTTQPNNPFNVTGVPEPHEWILIILVLMLLLFNFYQNKIKMKLGNNG